MQHVFVVDAGVLFTGWLNRHPEGFFLTTDQILNEIVNAPSRRRAGTFQSLGRLRAEAPDSRAMRDVSEAAYRTGDYGVLSESDASLIALALTKQREGFSVTVVSNDLALLNTAVELGLQVIDPTGRFRRKITWGAKCPACGHEERKAPNDGLCPVCGTPMRRHAVRKRGHRNTER